MRRIALILCVGLLICVFVSCKANEGAIVDTTSEAEQGVVNGAALDGVICDGEDSVDARLVGKWYYGKEKDITRISFSADGTGKMITSAGEETAFRFETVGDNIAYLTDQGDTPCYGKYSFGDSLMLTPPDATGTTVQLWNDGSIVGTWTEDGVAGIYTFNADGTGNIEAMGGWVVATMNYTFEDSILSVSINGELFGQPLAESDVGYVYFDGDRFHSDIGDGEPMVAVRNKG